MATQCFYLRQQLCFLLYSAPHTLHLQLLDVVGDLDVLLKSLVVGVARHLHHHLGAHAFLQIERDERPAGRVHGNELVLGPSVHESFPSPAGGHARRLVDAHQLTQLFQVVVRLLV